MDLQIVLKDLRFLDKVAFEIKPKTLLSDCRHVEFRPERHVHRDRFDEIMRSIRNRIGVEKRPRRFGPGYSDSRRGESIIQTSQAA